MEKNDVQRTSLELLSVLSRYNYHDALMIACYTAMNIFSCSESSEDGEHSIELRAEIATEKGAKLYRVVIEELKE